MTHSDSLRYINILTYLLTYLLTSTCVTGQYIHCHLLNIVYFAEDRGTSAYFTLMLSLCALVEIGLSCGLTNHGTIGLPLPYLYLCVCVGAVVAV